ARWGYIHEGDVAYLTGAWQQAQTQYRRAAELLGQIGPSFSAFDLPISMGQLALAQGRGAGAQGPVQPGIPGGQRGGVLHPLRAAQRLLAEWDMLAGRPEAACRRLETLLAERAEEEATAQVVEETYETWALRPVLAWAHLELGAEARAADLLSQ